MAVTEKSEACEKLLTEIQRATEQANEKKAMAVGKREEIAEQNKEIVVEKAEAEEALAQALPALEEAKLALQDLDKSDVTEIRYLRGTDVSHVDSKHLKLMFDYQAMLLNQ